MKNLCLVLFHLPSGSWEHPLWRGVLSQQRAPRTGRCRSDLLLDIQAADKEFKQIKPREEKLQKISIPATTHFSRSNTSVHRLRYPAITEQATRGRLAQWIPEWRLFWREQTRNWPCTFCCVLLKVQNSRQTRFQASLQHADKPLWRI